MDHLQITSLPLQVEQVIQSVQSQAAGGIAVFLGATRGEVHADGRTLIALEYEAYTEMADRQLQDLAARARQQWPVINLAIVHRTGRVMITQPSVIIAVSTPHRAEAFQACQWLIDTLKKEVTVWKKEIWDDGSGSWSEQKSQ